MARPVPPDRLANLVAAATRVFIAQGYRRTQMADVAAAMGVAKGTLYLAVASKAALFDLAVRYADAEFPPEPPKRWPLPTPKPGSTLALVRRRLGEAAIGPRLQQALREPPPADVRAELTAIIAELYARLSAQRTAIKLLDRCAVDHPALAALWFGSGRGAQLSAVHEYLVARAAAGRLRPLADLGVAARLVIESAAMWAVHRHFDPAPVAVDESAVEPTVTAALVAALLPDADAGRAR